MLRTSIKYIISASILLVFVVAAILFLARTYFYSLLQNPILPPVNISESSSMGLVTPEVTREYVLNEVEEANYCETDVDCQSYPKDRSEAIKEGYNKFVCLFPCEFPPINKKEFEHIQSLVSSYRGSCSENSCGFGSSLWGAAARCVENKCRNFPAETSKKSEFDLNKLTVVSSNPLWSRNYHDDKELIGDAHNVFVGRVINNLGVANYLGTITRFEVEVVHNIKGMLSGTVTVAQDGGVVGGRVYIVVDGEAVSPASAVGNYLLQPGQTYLLATRTSNETNWYRLIPHPNARAMISQNPTLSSTQLKALAKNDLRVQALETAYPDEIVLSGELRTYAPNSFQSLSGAEKQAVYARIAEFSPPPAPPPAPTSTPPVAPPPASTSSSTPSSTQQ